MTVERGPVPPEGRTGRIGPGDHRTEKGLWLFLIAAVLCASLLSLWYGARRNREKHVAGIYQDGVLIRTVDLDRVTEEERFPVEGEKGYNLLLIEPGRIRVAEADCPDRICVAQGWLPEAGLPLICLPHGLVVQMED